MHEDPALGGENVPIRRVVVSKENAEKRLERCTRK